MRIIELHNKLYSVPASWNELSRKQLLQLMELFLINIDAVQQQLVFLKILTGISQFNFFRVKAHEWEEYLYLANDFLKSDPLTKNLLPKIDNFYGPLDGFTNLRMKEYVFCEHWLQQLENGNDEAQNELIAILYREPKKEYDLEKNPEGDVRMEYSESQCNYNAKNIVKRWPAHVKLAVLYWYKGCKYELVKDYPDLFTGGGGEEPKYGLWSIMRGVADKGVHGNFQQVEKMYVREAFMEMTEMMNEARAMQEQTNEMI